MVDAVQSESASRLEGPIKKIKVYLWERFCKSPIVNRNPNRKLPLKNTIVHVIA